MPLRPIYYDLETTGIDSKGDRIVEIAAYDPFLEKTFEKLVNPQIPIPREAEAIHKISNEMVKDAPTFAEVGNEFVEFCQGDVVLIAHNNDNFDRLFLLHESNRHELKFPSWPAIDSLKWARKYRSDLPKHSLQFLRTIYGFPENQAHRALDDVMTLHSVFSAMIDDLTFETVLSLLSSNSEDEGLPSVMPFGKYRGKPLNTLPKDYIRWLKDQGALDKNENASLKKALEAVCKF